MSVVIGLIAGLAVFLIGLDGLTKSLKAQSGEGMQQLIAKLTPNRFAGMATGAGVTMLLQSSTITTVLAVGLVSGGMLTFVQSLGIILGANLGTTLTAQAIAFDTSTFGLALLGGGFLATKLVRGRTAHLIASVVLGIGLVFLGMDLMADAVHPLRESQWFLDLMASLTNPLLGALVGALFTAAVQSSTAATGVAIAMATEGLIPLEAGVAIIIGSNVGTCLTAGLAAIGKPAEAVRTAMFHLFVNLAGAIFWLIFIDKLVDVAIAISPSFPELSGIDRRAAETPRQFAMAHTVFNTSYALFLVWFLGPIARLLERLIPDRPVPSPPGAPRHLDDALLPTPWAALEAAREEVGVLGAEVTTLTDQAMPVLRAENTDPADALAAAETAIDNRYRHIVAFLREVINRDPGPDQSREAAALMDVADELEGIADLLELNVATLARERIARGQEFGSTELAVLEPIAEAVGAHLRIAVAGVVDPLSHATQKAAEQAPVVERTIAAASQASRDLLRTGWPVDSYALVDDMLDLYRRIYDSSARIVRARLTVEGSNLLNETGSFPSLR
ncbi:MAG: Na/Pi cotransporter family protein [Candidatus Nanopelagicales bacterium]